jgi:DNA-binding transcriptional regulator YiaG
MTTAAKKAQKTTAQKKVTACKEAPELIASPRGGTMLALRSQLKLKRDIFARMLPISTRSLATIESGETPSEAVTRRLIELQRIVDALSEVMSPETIGEWMTTPNDAFDGLKPLEVIERGEVDRIWQMIFLLRSGVPS